MIMSHSKRKYDADDPDTYSNKSQNRGSGEAIARVDPTYGQRSAIPGLDEDTRAQSDGDSLNYDEDQDALSYLRAVRQEARGIPNLLVAPRDNKNDRDIYDHGIGDYRARYEDGTYYAAPDASEEEVEVEESTHNANVAYFDSILARFASLQAQLQQVPPPSAVKKLDADHPTYIGDMNTSLARWWRWKLRSIDPIPAQVANMDKRTILKLLGLLSGGNLLQRGKPLHVGISRWAWALLAKLPTRGELNSEEIGVIRELGKKSVLVGMGLKDNAEYTEGMDVLEAGLDDEAAIIPGVINNAEINLEDEDEMAADPKILADEAATSLATATKEETATLTDKPMVLHETPMIEDDQASEDLATAKATALGALANEGGVPQPTGLFNHIDDANTWNAKATVDMILTVSGELYGQRDLLEFRAIWDQLP
ncbi:hypothetical protein BJ875DRAFT_440244 [Amylocarpus encephaloides]|uniref:Uncharacterized protein n=1 Tax=Amylocarpus encephaloides TaxID=45428 RepID=A0A9P7YKX4_9HELO|nr:hypothetical protein BJ875DRAFT_440244 [Amylocarpus encephaloides]